MENYSSKFGPVWGETNVLPLGVGASHIMENYSSKFGPVWGETNVLPLGVS